MMNNALMALRISHAIAMVMLFAVGWAFGHIAARHPWMSGVCMVSIGGVLVALCMALGG